MRLAGRPAAPSAPGPRITHGHSKCVPGTEAAAGLCGMEINLIREQSVTARTGWTAQKPAPRNAGKLSGGTPAGKGPWAGGGLKEGGAGPRSERPGWEVWRGPCVAWARTLLLLASVFSFTGWGGADAASWGLGAWQGPGLQSREGAGCTQSVRGRGSQLRRWLCTENPAKAGSCSRTRVPGG